MTKKIIDYTTRELMKAEKILKNSEGFRPLHTDFVDNDESNGYRITFVKGPDDPDNDPAEVAKRALQKTRTDRLRILKAKVIDDTISNGEVKEYHRLKAIME